MESESESESEWNPESSTDSHSLSESDREKKGKRGTERKMRKQTCKQTRPSSLAKPKTPLRFPKYITLKNIYLLRRDCKDFKEIIKKDLRHN